MAPANPDTVAEARRIVDQLFDGGRPVQVFVRDESIAYPVPKAILAAASPKLERLCETSDDIITLDEGFEAPQALLGWVLKRAIISTDQLVLTEAYTLGKKFEIPAFPTRSSKHFRTRSTWTGKFARLPWLLLTRIRT